MKLKDKVAIITGGASGIGKATVKLFTEAGTKVAIADLSESGKELSDGLNADGFDTCFIKTDVTNESDIQHMISKTVEKYGKLDILFANAGIAKDGMADQLTIDNWKKTIDINLTGVFLSDKYGIEQMLKQETGGVIVNSGSIHSKVGKTGVTAYAAAKGGVKLLTQTLGIDYAKRGIRVNAVCPGYVDTPLLKDADKAAKQSLIDLHPMGRLGTAEEVAKAVMFLASDDASFITGSTLMVDGGYTAQ